MVYKPYPGLVAVQRVLSRVLQFGLLSLVFAVHSSLGPRNDALGLDERSSLSQKPRKVNACTEIQLSENRDAVQSN